MKEISDYLENFKTIIIPVGATEEHSNALPLGTDSFTAEAIAVEVGKISNRVVAPTITVGNCHSITYEFKGTISLSPKTLILVVEDYLRSLYKHGARRFLFVNGHGGNIAPIRCAVDTLAVEFIDSRFAIGSWWLFKELADLYDNAGHAGRGEVSMMLYLVPSLVHREFFTEEKLSPPPYFVSNDRALYEVTSSGIIKDNQKGSSELGEKLFKKSVEVYLTLLKALES
jgi:creatinine amidohydrolase